MSKPKGRMSKAILQACTQNKHSKMTLQKDLSLLDKQRTRRAKSMQGDIDTIQQGVPNRLLSALIPPLVSGRARSASSRTEYSSPHRGFSYHCKASSSLHSGSSSPRTSSPSSRSRSSSPERKDTRLSLRSPSLLPQRKCRSAAFSSFGSPRRSSLPGNVEVTVTELKSKILQSSSAVNKLSASSWQNVHVNVPEIVVSDEASPEEQLTIQKKATSPKTSASDSPSSGSDSGSANDPFTPPSLLNPPRERPRSSSVPTIVLPASFKPPSPRPSYTPSDSDSSYHLLLARSSPRDGFSGIVPARRRGSIPERWGSLSERVRPSRIQGRRRSVDMDRVVRDLRYGVLNRELLRAAKSRSPSPPGSARSAELDRRWEGLRECRYLRIPSRHASDEEVSSTSSD
ncbi:hypothetical protein ACOMHN_067640 [Nucella lapillus]